MYVISILLFYLAIYVKHFALTFSLNLNVNLKTFRLNIKI